MIKKIEFFTAGCPRSQITGKNLKKALEELGLKAEVFEEIDDPKVHVERGVSAFPAVKINDEIKSEGPFLSVDACKEILSDYTET